MTTTGIDTFDRTVQKTERWLNDLMTDLQWESRKRALHGFRAVLHALRDRLPLAEMAHLGAQLPILVRGLFYENWRPSEQPARYRTKADFFERVREDFEPVDDAEIEELTEAVFELIQREVAVGEADNIKRVLPADLQELWPPATEE